MSDLTFRAQDLAPTVLFLVAAAAYVAYHYGANAKALARRLHVDAGSALAVTLQRVLGAVLLGVVPTAVAAGVLEGGLADLNLALPSGSGALAALAVYALVLPALLVSCRKPQHRARYPLIRDTRWTTGLYALNAAGWALYLAGYELFFRGLLLVPLAGWIGPWPAIAITTALYTYAHLPKDAGETAGCVVMGVVFGALALGSGSVVVPFALHLAIALTSDVLSKPRHCGGANREAGSRDDLVPQRQCIRG